MSRPGLSMLIQSAATEASRKGLVVDRKSGEPRNVQVQAGFNALTKQHLFRHGLRHISPLDLAVA